MSSSKRKRTVKQEVQESVTIDLFSSPVKKEERNEQPWLQRTAPYVVDEGDRLGAKSKNQAGEW